MFIYREIDNKWHHWFIVQSTYYILWSIIIIKYIIKNYRVYSYNNQNYCVRSVTKKTAAVDLSPSNWRWNWSVLPRGFTTALFLQCVEYTSWRISTFFFVIFGCLFFHNFVIQTIQKYHIIFAIYLPKFFEVVDKYTMMHNP